MPFATSQLSHGIHDYDGYYGRELAEPVVPELYPVGETIPEAAYRRAAGRVALDLTSTTAPPSASWQWPEVSDYLRYEDDSPPPWPERLRANRYAFAAALGCGMVESAIDWQAVDPDDPTTTIRLKPQEMIAKLHGRQPVTRRTEDRPIARSIDDSLCQAVHDQLTTHCRQSFSEWHGRTPEYVEALTVKYDDLQEHDVSNALSRLPIDSELAYTGEGPVNPAALMTAMLIMRRDYPASSAVGGLSRDRYVQALHDIAESVVLRRAHDHISNLRRQMFLYSVRHPQRRADLSRLRLVALDDNDAGQRYSLDDDGQFGPIGRNDGDAAVVRLMCPLLRLCPDNPAVAFRPQTERPATGFRTYLHAWLHAAINSCVEEGTLMPNDFD